MNYRHDRARGSALLVLLALFLGPTVASGQEDGDGPSIRAVWGERSNGSTIRLEGSHFGTHPLAVESTVGPRGWIESSESGVRIPDLDGDHPWATFATQVPPYIDDTRAHSGRHSVNASVDRAADGDWNKILYYTREGGFGSIYATWWIYFDPIRFDEDTQWKMWRVSDPAGDMLAWDNCASLLQSSRWSPAKEALTSHTVFWCMLDCGWEEQRKCYEHVVADPPYAPIDNDVFNFPYHSRGGTQPFAQGLPLPGAWCRAEVFVQASDPDVPNGRFWLSIQHPDRPRFVVENWVDGLMTHSSNCCSDQSGRWEHFILHGYWDDDGGPFPDEIAEMFYDDIYLQFDTVARVELGDQPMYASCRQLEIQTPVSWTDDVIEIELNHGAFPADAAVWLYVIDESGRVSEGMPARLR